MTLTSFPRTILPTKTLLPGHARRQRTAISILVGWLFGLVATRGTRLIGWFSSGPGSLGTLKLNQRVDDRMVLRTARFHWRLRLGLSFCWGLEEAMIRWRSYTVRYCPINHQLLLVVVVVMAGEVTVVGVVAGGVEHIYFYKQQWDACRMTRTTNHIRSGSLENFWTVLHVGAVSCAHGFVPFLPVPKSQFVSMMDQSFTMVLVCCSHDR